MRSINQILGNVESCMNKLEKINLEICNKEITNILYDLDYNFSDMIFIQKSLGDLIYEEEEKEK